MSDEKIRACLWYDGTAAEAANFYAATFPDSRVTGVHRAPDDYPDGKKGSVLTVEFTVFGMHFIGLNGGPQFKFDEAGGQARGHRPRCKKACGPEIVAMECLVHLRGRHTDAPASPSHSDIVLFNPFRSRAARVRGLLANSHRPDTACLPEGIRAA